MRAVTLRILITTLVALLLTSGLCFAEPPQIVNVSEPMFGVTTLELEPLWTIGGSEEGVLLGTIERVLTTDDGRILLMDSQLSQILECSPDGEVIRRLGRSGDGPGEITNPRDLVRFEDGILGLIKVFPGELVLLAPDGTPAGSIKPVIDDAPGGFLTLHRALQTGGTLLLGGSVMTMNPSTPIQSRTFFLASFDRDGNRMTEYTRDDVTLDFKKGELHESWQEYVWSRMAVHTDGTVVVCIPRDEFSLSWFSPDGTLLRSAALPAEPWKRNKFAHDRMYNILEPQADHIPGTKAVAAETEPVVVDLFVRTNGDVWCLTAKSMWEPEDGIFAGYDVFDSTGSYTERIQVVCDGDATRDRLFVSDGRAYRVAGYWDAVYRVRGEEADEDAEPMSVTCYRIK